MLDLGQLPKLGNRKLSIIQIDRFNLGVITNFSETRLPNNAAKEATNMMLIEDGIWDKRWGTAQYGGVSWTADIDGFTEYRKSNGTRELIVIADGQAWVVDPAASSKTAISGASFTAGNKCYFVQIKDLLYVANGVNALARYNGTSFSTYSSISVPSWAGTPLARGAGLSAGGVDVYYRVTASNDIGETTASTEQTITVNKERDIWVLASNEYVDLDWTAVASALLYTIYYSDASGFEVRIAQTNNDTYRDDGSAVPNPYIEPPDEDQTAGPKFTSMCISGNRIWATGDPDNPHRVYFSGSGVYLGYFSSTYGGGWVDLEKGGRATTVSVVDYQGKAHVICQTDDGRGQVWQVTLESQTIGDSTFIVPIPSKIIASSGTPSARSVVYVENDVFYFNDKGVTVLGNEPGVLNVLRTNEVSANIRNYVRELSQDMNVNVCGYYYDAKVFFSVATTSGDNNRIIVYDRERLAWIKDWTIGVSQFGEYTDVDGRTHFIAASANKLIEFSDSFEGDQNVAFTWRYVSPRIPVSKNWTEFARIRRVYLRLRNTRGSVTFSVAGTKKGTSFTALGSGTITPGSSDTGIGWDLMGSVMMGDSAGTPSTFADESLIQYMTINKLIRDIQVTLSGDSLSDRAALTGLLTEGKIIPTAKPSSWKLTVA